MLDKLISSMMICASRLSIQARQILIRAGIAPPNPNREIPALDQLSAEAVWLEKFWMSHPIEKAVEPRESDGYVLVHCNQHGFLGGRAGPLLS